MEKSTFGVAEQVAVEQVAVATDVVVVDDVMVAAACFENSH